MANDRDPSQQTEEPTQRRLDQAREKGDQIKSVEVQTLVVLLGGTLSIAMFGRHTCEGLVRLLRTFLSEPDRFAVDPGALVALMRSLLTHLFVLLGPVFVVLILFGLGSNFIQAKPTFATERLAPDFSRLSPINGFKRIFGVDGISNLLKGVLKIVIVGLAVWTQVWPERIGLEATLGQSAGAVAGDMTRLLFRMMMAALAAVTAIAVADFFLQRYQFLKRNRMSKQEVKEEFKETDGDPQIKARIRQIRIERAKKRMIAQVPKAAVVIVNPTHYAVALQYEQGVTPAPVCLAKGVDTVAFRIRSVAEENHIPVVENPPLARALYASVEIDQAIPPEHYKAVAQVIGYVLKLTGKLKP
jgi:flagellar biosynthetic protein FlhB